MPIISIIVPVYNTESYLHRCIDSILTQTFIDFECILVNDGSHDNCPTICNEYAEKDVRVLVIHQKNGGSSDARNTGLCKAKGEWIGFVDSDDWIEPDMFEKMYVKAISENCDMVWCDYYMGYLHGSKYIKAQIENLEKTDIIKKIFAGQLHGSVCNKLIKKNISLCNSIYFPSANFMEDFVFIIQNLYYAEKIGYVSNALYHYEFNPNSITNNKTGIRVEEWCKNLYFIIEFMKNKYNRNIIKMEPELSSNINAYKLYMLKTKKTSDMKKILSFYPESHRYIFSKKFSAHLISKIFLFLATKGMIFPNKIFDILLFLKLHIARKIKKMISSCFIYQMRDSG